jgi:xanthine dehydrogenase large subunit
MKNYWPAIMFLFLRNAGCIGSGRREKKRWAAVAKIDIDPYTLSLTREAKEKGELIIPQEHLGTCDTNNGRELEQHIVEGSTETNGQEHLYIETQGAYALPLENGGIRVYSSTQGPTAVQRTTARVLDLPMNKIEVDTTRLGGGFGGKEDQATTWGVMCALASYHLKRPKYSLQSP